MAVHDENRDIQHDMRKENEGFNWWPLLVLPLAFFIGWGTNEALTTDRDMSTRNGTQVGVGGGPITPCITPDAGAME